MGRAITGTLMVMDDAASDVLRRYRTWAVVGISPDETRDSHRVARTLRQHGYRILPINPFRDEILGERCWPTLLDVPPEIEIDVVDLFRRSDQVGAHVDEAIAVGAHAVWFQLGVRDDLAAARARRAGMLVVENRCPAIELPALAPASRR